SSSSWRTSVGVEVAGYIGVAVPGSEEVGVEGSVVAVGLAVEDSVGSVVAEAQAAAAPGGASDVHQTGARVVAHFRAHADAVLPQGYSAVLYGSAARGDFVPGWSDINLMVVVDALAREALRGLGPGLGEWRKAAGEPPLLITRPEWARASDVFPIEI